MASGREFTSCGCNAHCSTDALRTAAMRRVIGKKLSSAKPSARATGRLFSATQLQESPAMAFQEKNTRTFWKKYTAFWLAQPVPDTTTRQVCSLQGLRFTKTTHLRKRRALQRGSARVCSCTVERSPMFPFLCFVSADLQLSQCCQVKPLWGFSSTPSSLARLGALCGPLPRAEIRENLGPTAHLAAFVERLAIRCLERI